MSEFVCAKVEIQETAATIGAQREFIPHAVEAIKAARLDIERQIRKDRFFLTTLEPYAPEKVSSRIIERMCEASKVAGVGPMATVAGTIAQGALEAMEAAGCTNGWVDNGGDIALKLNEPATLEVFSEPGSASAFALELERTDGHIGICTSSGRLGHSISFGDADVAVVMAEDAVLADALATAVANRVSQAEDLRTCFSDFKSVSGFIGGLAMYEGSVATHGRLPRIIEVEHRADRLTVHTKMSSSKYLGAQQQRTEVGT
ncbi:MAG: hypothetical protein A3K60_06405 [Euryarchaeota archaeon RBG_19FT_COMBO_56_21]|nr:MAG: hypothetical protein A3K60_06405 [Euryarchaeota archaeon RBG_19FT_COMBO_56_21]